MKLFDRIDRFLSHQLGPVLGVAVLLVALGGAGVYQACADQAAVSSTPKPDLMDNPIPPARVRTPNPPPLLLPDQVGYCVTFDGDRVDVPLHRPDRTQLGELRASVRNALELIANQSDVHALTEPEPRERMRATLRASRLHAKLARGVLFMGEAAAMRPVPINGGDGGGGVVCTCATLQDAGGTLPPRYMCGGACGNCWSCK